MGQARCWQQHRKDYQTLIAGYSLGQGIGTALLIPPVYILATVFTTDVKSRARAFGAISAAAGIGSAAGPLIGGLITSALSWRVAFVVQALLAVIIVYMGRRIEDPGVQGPKPRFDLVGAVLSAAGLFIIVVGILLAGDYGWLRAAQDFVIGSTVVIPQGWHLTGNRVRADWGASVVLVLSAHSVDRTGREAAIAVHQDVPEPRVQSWSCDTEHSMAGSPGPLVCGLRLPADSTGL